MESICQDLAAEHEALDALIGDLRDKDWDRPTPADGWSIRDQISHLAYFDAAAHQAVVDPDGFREQARVMMAAVAEGKAAQAVEVSVEKGRAVNPQELLAWWRSGREIMIKAFLTQDPKDRIPWYGLDMGARSFATARLMETWAHGQDIVDALDVTREPSERLRHIAHIANGARPYSYLVNGLELPEGGVRVELESPAGDRWTWGDADAADRIVGSALDFCLLATQRRHRDDVGLVVTGEGATQWSKIMQTFAGPAGSGRPRLSP